MPEPPRTGRLQSEATEMHSGPQLNMAKKRTLRRRDAKVLAAKINSATFTVTCDLAPGYANFRA